jgi:transglutaminase-like putative cysteine protease
MLDNVISWGWRRLKPAEGWLPFVLLLAIISIMASAVLSVEWVPETTVVVWAGLLGLILGSILARRPIRWQFAWAFIAVYGMLLIALVLGQLIPDFSTIFNGWNASSAHIRQNLSLFFDRIGGWFDAVYGGGSSEETIVFALALGLLAWILAAYAGWSTFRQRRPLAGLTVMGFALAINGFFGNAPLWPAAIFVGLAALLAATFHFANLESGWNQRGIDYSTEIRLELLGVSGAIALALLALSFVLPTVNIRALTQTVLDQPAIHEAEKAFERAFAGVRQPRLERVEIDIEGLPGQRGTLPRSFLLGAPPELYETVVLTATTDGVFPLASHWRGFSYDVYTGRGWTISAERQEWVRANQDILLPPNQGLQSINQTVNWVQPPLNTRYTLGLPVRFDQDVSTFWRGRDDLSRVQSPGRTFTAISRVSGASPSELRQAALSGVPPAIMARYTALPESIPERVAELAKQVGGDPQLSPYDQAKTLERFLRQYPYSLDVELPPPGADPVDFFLFDLQSGYCDYYASAMVVMARSIGLPARLAAGFLAQPADEKGQQTLYQINAHSWAEVYIAGFGWVEFEPTAAFLTRDTGQAIPVRPEFARDDPLPITYPPPIPTKEFQGISPIWWLLVVAIMIPVLWVIWRWRQRRAAQIDGLEWAYSRLLGSANRLGQPTPPSQTPAEFKVALLRRLKDASRPNWLKNARRGVQPDIERLSSFFVTSRYGGRPPSSDQARESWRNIRIRMWLLGTYNRIFNQD